MKSYTAPDGTSWRVEVQCPGSSNAMVVFRHPGGGTARRDRYNWYLSRSPESHNVTARLDPSRVLESLSDRELALLFRRSMPIDAKKMGVDLVAQ